mgnify:CR=1 FL=1
MDFLMTNMRRTHIRVRSWHDIVLVAALIGVYILMDFVLKKAFPKLSPKAVNIISGITVIVVGIVGYILITPFTQE